MKAALIGGEYHGKAIDVLLPKSRLYIPRKLPNTTLVASLVGDLVLFDMLPDPEIYDLQATWTTRDNSETLLTYTHDSTLVANYNDTMLRVAALNHIVRHFGVTVGLNRWLDTEQETRLCYDADLQRSLFAARIQYDCEIAEIVGRRTNERLIRRFPETFSDS